MCSPPSLILRSSAMRRAKGLAYTLPPPDCASAGAAAGALAAGFGGAAAGAGASAAGAAASHKTTHAFSQLTYKHKRSNQKQKKILFLHPIYFENEVSKKSKVTANNIRKELCRNNH